SFWQNVRARSRKSSISPVLHELCWVGSVTTSLLRHSSGKHSDWLVSSGYNVHPGRTAGKASQTWRARGRGTTDASHTGTAPGTDAHSAAGRDDRLPGGTGLRTHVGAGDLCSCASVKGRTATPFRREVRTHGGSCTTPDGATQTTAHRGGQPAVRGDRPDQRVDRHALG